LLSRNIKKIREAKGLGVNELGRRTGLSPSYLSALERRIKTNPSMETLGKISEALEVAIDRLTGESASSIIEARLEEKGMTEEELAEKAQVPLKFIVNMDNIVPDQEIDGGEQSYTFISSIAWILDIPPSKLRLAFARQEIPSDQSPKERTPAAEDFAEPLPNLTPIEGRIVKLPLLGKIAAGRPLECEENKIGYKLIPEDQVKNGDYFYLRVQGDSMVGSGIASGYDVLVRKQKEVENGEIAVVRVNHEEATLKRVKRINGQTVLYPDNPKYEPIIISSADAEIIGKVVKVEFDTNKKY
jgi:SOS regulatory protein LexA